MTDSRRLGRRRAWMLALSILLPLQSAQAGPPTPPEPYRWQALPAEAPAPADNPTTPAKVALGHRLFHDKRLSVTGEIACASCHDLQGRGGADGRQVARGIRGRLGQRNVPTVWNAAFQTRLFWDGRAASLEEQARGPLTHPSEMGLADLAQAEQRLAVDPGYRRAFRAAFGGPDGVEAVSGTRMLAALAAFERTLITPDSPYDRFVAGDRRALTPRQVRGMALFESVGCVRCHAGPNFSGASVFDGGAPYRAFPALPSADVQRLGLTLDKGRAASDSDPGVWRIPSLRNVALTAPYFHNGSVRTLKEAVRIMAEAQLGLRMGETPAQVVRADGGRSTPELRTQLARSLRTEDLDALVAFLQALSSERLMGDGQRSSR